MFGKGRNMNLDFYLRDIVFFDGTCYSCKSHCGSSMNCTEDLDYLVQEVRATCKNLMSQCWWNNVQFDCCSHFLPLPTETGLCYTINSIQTPRHYKSNLSLYSNKKTGPGHLKLQVFEAIKVFIHSPEDVPFINHPQDEKAVLNWGTTFSINFQVTEIENDPVLSEVSVEQRICRFPNENTLSLYKYYSYSACIVECRANAQIKFCNCTHHYMPKTGGVKTCDIKGLTCLTSYSETLRALKTKGSSKTGLVCDCMSSCIEPEYTVTHKGQVVNEEEGSKISIVMDTLPSRRFKRNVVRTRLDLVVSMGGTAGLFLGASLLSTVEIVYFLLLRRRKMRHWRGEKKKNISKENFFHTKEPEYGLKRMANGQQDGYLFPYLS